MRDRSSRARWGQARLTPATAKNRMRVISATWVFGDMGPLLAFRERLSTQKFRTVDARANPYPPRGAAVRFTPREQFGPVCGTDATSAPGRTHRQFRRRWRKRGSDPTSG